MTPRAERKRCAVPLTRTPDLGVMNHHLGKTQVFSFARVAATKNFRAFPVLCHSVPSVISLVLLILDTIWPHEGRLPTTDFKSRDRGAT